MGKVDYERMRTSWPKQQTALATALAADYPDNEAKINAVRKVALEAVLEWEEIGAWPDDWSMFDRALADVQHWSDPTDLQALLENHRRERDWEARKADLRKLTITMSTGVAEGVSQEITLSSVLARDFADALSRLNERAVSAQLGARIGTTIVSAL